MAEASILEASRFLDQILPIYWNAKNQKIGESAWSQATQHPHSTQGIGMSLQQPTIGKAPSYVCPACATPRDYYSGNASSARTRIGFTSGQIHWSPTRRPMVPGRSGMTRRHGPSSPWMVRCSRMRRPNFCSNPTWSPWTLSAIHPQQKMLSYIWALNPTMMYK